MSLESWKRRLLEFRIVIVMMNFIPFLPDSYLIPASSTLLVQYGSSWYCCVKAYTRLQLLAGSCTTSREVEIRCWH